MVANVIIDVGHTKLDRVFEYLVPAALESQIAVGQRVVVPFGMGNKKTEAFVLGLGVQPTFDPSKLKAIQKIAEIAPVLRDEQIELARWMADEYNCLLIDALRLMIPAQLRGDRVREKTVRTARLAIEGDEWNAALASLTGRNGRVKAPTQRALLEALQAGETDVAALEPLIPGASNALAALAKKGWVAISERGVYRKPYASMRQHDDTDHEATDEQLCAIEAVTSAIDAGEGAFVLRGVTGSGKTEVYMRCIRHCLDRGKTAIMLVPEISLTPQTVDRFRSRFGADVAVLHSRLSAGERYDEWRRIRDGHVKVAVGARSAVFAPFERLGLIAIDEEHETSYQSDKTPRYAASDIARKRCRSHGAALLLGSATPAIETWHGALRGESAILTLNERIQGRALPEVEIVDMRAELAQGNRSMFSSPLYQRMKECYFAGQQMILFLNRRGYSTFVSCRACGQVLTCGACDVSMTYHKTDNTVRCHYCDAQQTIPPICPACGQAAIKHFGVGTQQVEEQVAKLFPGIRTIRMDYDTTRSKDAHASLLQAFGDKEADVLIGTQMIAKGLDFPGVTLVGVIAADASLHVPDFRNAERSFQLLTQVAGRAGRDVDPGRVVIQTYSPQHPAIQLSQKHDYEAFYTYEIACRRQNEFPPFADFVRFLFTGEDESALAHVCKDFRADLESRLQAFFECEAIPKETLLYISAHAAPLHLLRGAYREQVVLKVVRTEHSRAILRFLGAYLRSRRDNDILPSMEINPQSMN